MFGLLIPGRPIQTAPTQTLSPTQHAFAIPAAPAFSHLALFLLPGEALPADALAAIYIRLGSQPDFRLLGALAHDKPSAVFRLAGSAGAGGGSGSAPAVREEIMLDDATGEPLGEDVVVGVSLEPAAQVLAQLAALRGPQQQQGSQGQSQALVVSRNTGGGTPSVPQLKEAARRIGRNAYNFLSGFAQSAPGGEVVPLKSVQDWWSKFEKKVDMDVGFLMKEGEGDT